MSLVRYVVVQLKKLKLLPLLLLTILTTTFASHATPVNFDTNLKVEHITTAQGLSQSYVYDIIQDEESYIWMATQDGINKYDGNKFIYYRNNISDPNSLADNVIRILFKDSSNNIWVGTDNGLSFYNKTLDNFKNYKSNNSIDNTLTDNAISAIYEDNNKNIWVATQNAIHKYDRENDNFTPIKIRKGTGNALLDLKAVSSIFQDERKNLWLSSISGGNFHILSSSLSPDTALKNKVISEIGLDTLLITNFSSNKEKNEYWISTEHEIFILDFNYNLKSRYKILETAEKREKVNSVHKLSDSHFWVATDNGLYSINPLQQTSKQHVISNAFPQANNNIIYKVFVDKSGTVWLGTANGIFKLSPFSNLIKHSSEIDKEFIHNTYAIISSDEGVWFTSDNSLYQYDQLNEVHKLIYEADSFIYQIVNSADSIILLTEDNQLFSINKKTGLTQKIEYWRDEVNHNDYTRIFYYQQHVYYLTNKGNLSKINLNNGLISPYHFEDNSFTSIHLDIEKNLWLTSENGKLYNLKISESKLSHITVNESTNFLIEKTTTINVSDTHIILGSNTQGALLINRKTNNSTLFNEANGLSNNFVSDIIVDGNNFWIGTNKGVNLLNSQNNSIKSFYDDFYFESFEYVSQSSALDSNGNIFFGGTNGFHYFSTSDLENATQELPSPVLSNLLIANKKIKVSKEKANKSFHLKENLNNLSRLTLKYTHSPFSIEFVSPNAKLPNQIGYRYKLQGLDENWIETGIDNLRATYTNLNSGDYKFIVEAYDIYNPRAIKSKSLDLKILPPWWLSNSAVLIYTLIGLLIIAYLLQQFRNKRLYHLQIKASEERLKLSLWGSGDEMWDWNIKRGKIYRSNIWGILEFPQDGKRNVGNDGDNETNVNKNDINRITEALQDHFDDKTEHFEATYRVKDKNDQWIWVLDRGKIVERDDNNQPTRMTGTLKDISQIKKADERLKLFAKCIENISDAVVIYDRAFKIVDVNKAYQRITGRTKVQMIGKPLKFNQYPESFTSDVKKHLITKGGWHGEIESRRDNDQKYLTDLNIDIIRDEHNAISHFVGVFSDITKRKETEAELRKLANTDTLTGLPNRSYFQAHQNRLVNKKIPHALLVFDLDNFKKVNDSMGHEVGDILLCKVAERLRSVGRKLDSIYRLGGDEFALIVEDTNDIHTITSIAKNILRTIAQPLKLKSQEIVLYSSIGIVLYPEDGVSGHDLLKNADTAMYHAKHSGGNQYEFFNGSMNEQAVKRLQIEGLIRHGLKEDYFSVFYQPKIDIKTGKVAGMEALVRFETPSKGIISPIVFIPVSEETGQIIDIGEVVLRKACYATKEWVDAGLFDGRTAVNLSAVQFTQPNLVGMIKDILDETKLPAKYLELEITEGTVMDSPQRAIETMLQIRAMGIHLSLDDFGTGYSSLAYLKKFPLNTLKIDKAFVDDIETSEQGRNMVATIVTIAHNLGLQVVAEGVETNQQLSFLSGLRCEQLQGYLYSKPLPQKDFRSYLLSHQITDKSTSFNQH